MTIEEYLGCCGSTRFAREMALVGPFSSLHLAVEAAKDIWWNKAHVESFNCSLWSKDYLNPTQELCLVVQQMIDIGGTGCQVDVPGWLEAFAAHPRIGDLEALHTRFASESFCSGEQATALNSANEHTLQELADWNRQYEVKFGFVFLICASGKSSTEILAALKERYSNRPFEELQNAASEQQKITELRLAKLMSTTSEPEGTVHKTEEALPSTPKPSTTTVSSLRPPITTHVLDISLGKPASGIEISLHWWTETSHSAAHESYSDDQGFWARVGQSVTNNDGRSGPLMPASNKIQPGKYRLTFNTGAYLARLHGGDKHEGSDFYPYVMVIFEIKPSQASEHFHIPVLLAPYSFSTYRGS